MDFVSDEQRAAVMAKLNGGAGPPRLNAGYGPGSPSRPAYDVTSPTPASSGTPGNSTGSGLSTDPYPIIRITPEPTWDTPSQGPSDNSHIGTGSDADPYPIIRITPEQSYREDPKTPPQTISLSAQGNQDQPEKPPSKILDALGSVWDKITHQDTSEALYAPPRSETQNTGVLGKLGAAWDWIKKADANVDYVMGGFTEGALEGLEVAWDKLSYGMYGAAKEHYTGEEIDYGRDDLRYAGYVSVGGREILLTALGGWAVGKMGQAVQASKLAMLAKPLSATSEALKLNGAFGRGVTNALTAYLGFKGKMAVDDYREAHPTMNPLADKALANLGTLSGYIGSVGVLKSLRTAFAYAGTLIPAGNKLNLLQRASKLAQGTGSKVEKWYETQVASKTGWKVWDKFQKFQGKLGDNLGATLTDISSLPRSYKAVARAKAWVSPQQWKMERLRVFSDDLNKLGSKHWRLAKIETDPVKQAALYVKADDFYKQGRRWGRYADKMEISFMRKKADLISKAMAELKTAKRFAVVAGGIVAGRTAYDEYKIAGEKKRAQETIDAGKKFTIPDEKARGTLATIGSAAIGTTHNATEKMFRYGSPAYYAQQGLYRAQYENVRDQEKAGMISHDEAEAIIGTMNKPYQTEGKGLYQTAAASMVFFNWKIGDALKRARRSEVVRITKNVDGDTVHADFGYKTGDGFWQPWDQPRDERSIRFLDINTPEIPHPEHGKYEDDYMGQEATENMARMLKPGQYAIVEQDSHDVGTFKDDAGRDVDIHGSRVLGRVRTLPQPFDNLLRLPVIGPHLGYDTGLKQVKDGLADIHYRELSGYTDTQKKYDDVRDKARKKGEGIWDERGREELKWVGKEKTTEEARDLAYFKATGQQRPKNWLNDVQKYLGLGLMSSGNSGVLNPFGMSGSAFQRTYNAVVAVLGAIEYNLRANATVPGSTRSRGKFTSGAYDAKVSEIQDKFAVDYDKLITVSE